MSQGGGSAGELWTDPETAEVMTTILADFYREALKSLEKQLNGDADPSGQRKLLPNGRKDPVSVSLPVLLPTRADASDLLMQGFAASLTL